MFHLEASATDWGGLFQYDRELIDELLYEISFENYTCDYYELTIDQQLLVLEIALSWIGNREYFASQDSHRL